MKTLKDKETHLVEILGLKSNVQRDLFYKKDDVKEHIINILKKLHLLDKDLTPTHLRGDFVKQVIKEELGDFEEEK
jgi:hypothetical protein